MNLIETGADGNAKKEQEILIQEAIIFEKEKGRLSGNQEAMELTMIFSSILKKAI